MFFCSGSVCWGRLLEGVCVFVPVPFAGVVRWEGREFLFRCRLLGSFAGRGVFFLFRCRLLGPFVGRGVSFWSGAVCRGRLLGGREFLFRRRLLGSFAGRSVSFCCYHVDVLTHVSLSGD